MYSGQSHHQHHRDNHGHHHGHGNRHREDHGPGRGGCCEPSRFGDGGPAMFYGYCHDSGRMRMMNYSDYASNMQTGYSNLYGGTAAMQPYLDMLQGRGGGGQAWRSDRADRRHRDFDRHDRHDCHFHDCDSHGYDCHCSCCVRCADVLEYARCGELRQVPVTFQNDTRRELPVKLQLGAFATDSGTQLDWQAGLSDSEFTLGPCGEKTVLVSVTVNCSAFGRSTDTALAAGAASDSQGSASTVHSCKVAYATLSAQGCTIRPLVIALAVLPNDCGAYRAGCQCGCCC